MVKRRRGKILLDSIDMNIMFKLKEKPLGVMELRDKIGLKHKNLKAHLTRLSDRKLIDKKPVSKSRKILLSLSKNKKTESILKTFK